MYTAQDIAEYFLYKANDYEDLISNKKVQKLLYYAQGFHLAIYDKPLFDGSILVDKHGPVVPSVYRLYTEFGSNCIPLPETFDLEKYDADTQGFLDEVFQVYGQFSAPALRNMSYDEPPCKNAHNDQISLESMKSFFKTRIN